MTTRIGARLALTILAGAGGSAGSAQAAPPLPYTANCQVCHRAEGTGLPGQFPRLAGRANVIAASPEGRAYLVELMLSGMAGKILVDAKPIMGVMPPFARLSDADIATTLTFVSGLNAAKKVAPFTAAEVKAVRAKPRKNAVQVKQMREALAAANKIP